jgi:hypothetical protein
MFSRARLLSSDRATYQGASPGRETTLEDRLDNETLHNGHPASHHRRSESTARTTNSS